LGIGCVRAPEIVMVDRATALEQQASGSFGDVERDLERAGVAPVPVPLTPAQLEALGMKARPLTNASEQTEADRVDMLLKQHCIGEGVRGLLVDTHDDCRGASDRATEVSLVERVNEARLQLWRWMHEERPKWSVDQVRESWRKEHLGGVVCGAWVEQQGGWGEKKC
jgi:hypothetical protein